MQIPNACTKNRVGFRRNLCVSVCLTPWFETDLAGSQMSLR